MLTVAMGSLEELAHCQQTDDVTRKQYDALHSSLSTPLGKSWQQSPFHHYKQLWSQLTFVNGVLCKHYSPGPTAKTITLPVLPRNFQAAALRHCHDAPTAGHLGCVKTLHKLQQEAYWVYMSRDVDQYCRQCCKCNTSKPPAVQRASMSSVPISKTCHMVVADILEVPVSASNNH